jgi:hypothetical protein
MYRIGIAEAFESFHVMAPRLMTVTPLPVLELKPEDMMVTGLLVGEWLC